MSPGIALCLAALGAPAPPGVFEGVARIAGTDRPAARVPLRFFDPASKVDAITDDQGRFRVEFPRDRMFVPAVAGQVGPPCSALAQDPAAWRAEVVDGDPIRPQEFARTRVLEGMMKRAPTRWEPRGVEVRLVVDCPAMGESEVAVRGPGGTMAADRPVFLFAEEGRWGNHWGASIRFAGKTDAGGLIRVRWFEGIRRLRILVPGVGFGATGSFEAVDGRTARPDLPPLARFARVEGRLDPRLAGPGTRVHLGSSSSPETAWDRAEAEADEQGRFALTDVVPGPHRLLAIRDGQKVATGPLSLDLAPGQERAGVALVPPQPPTPRPANSGPPNNLFPRPRGGEAREVVWAQGTVRDEQGRTLPGADVHLHASFFGSERPVADLRSSHTDAQGHYQIQGPSHHFVQSPEVIVHAQGRPPAVGYAPRRKAEGDPAPLDLTVARKGASASVTVLKDGKPLPGASVRVAGTWPGGLPGPFDSGLARGPTRDAILALIQPTARTGPDGVARFENLFPGAFELAATAEPDPARLGGLGWPRNQALTFGTAEAAAAAGGRIEHAIAVHPQPCQVRLRVLRPDGQPVAGQAVALSFGLRGDTTTSTSLKLDDQGIGTHAFESPGLWTVDVRFRDSALRSIPIGEEPYYSARAVLPVSPGLPLADPLELTGVLRDRGSIGARLADAEGRPAPGTILIVRSFGGEQSIEQAGTTDAEGVVRFAGLPSGDYDLRGVIDGLAPPFEPSPEGPMPEDAAMLGQLMVPGLKLKLEPGAEAPAELRARGVGYVRGTLKPPTGRKVSDYVVIPHFDPRDQTPKWRLDAETGQYACGPLLPGRHTFGIRTPVPALPWPEAGSTLVEVAAGQITRAGFEPVDPPSTGLGQRAILGTGGLDEPGQPPLIVFQADGQTPAFAARALLFLPGQVQAMAEGVSDGSGRITWRNRWISMTAGPGQEPRHVTRPTAVITLPGLAGAAFIEVEPIRPIRAILPEPASVAGRVTLGGRPVDGRNARIRVVAAYQGRGVLDAALGREASAQADGRFELRGLTPGRYVVQAARDGIWLSKAVELAVAQGNDPPALALEIPDPGEPVRIELVDEKGRPFAHASIRSTRPEGPLALPPTTTVRADARGLATLRGLEAGRAPFQVEGLPGRYSLPVQAAGQGESPRVERVVILRPGP